MGHFVFISYSHQDKAVADAVCHRLEAASFRCWIAPRDVIAGKSWDEAVVDAINAAKLLVVIFSAAANTSRQVLAEVVTALDAGVTVIPFRIEDIRPTGALNLHLGRVHWLDAVSEPLEAHIERLIQSVRQNLLTTIDQEAASSLPQGITEPSPQTEGSVPSLQIATPPSLTEPAPLPLPDKPSIAVLPFRNLSGDPEPEMLADGVAQDIIAALARYPSLFVIARNSSFTYKGRAVDLKQIGRELGVRYVLEGSLHKANNHIRITAELVETETARHIWADRYDRDLSDIFAVQDEIAQAVTIAIAPAVADAERKRSMRRPPGSLDAWTGYQRGLWHLANFSVEDARKAQQFFRRTIDLDLQFAGGYAGLALSHLDFGSIWGLQDLAEAQNVAEQWTRRGVAADGADAQVRSVLAITLYMRGDHAGAITEAQTALALSPNLAEAHGVLGQTLIFSGRPREGLASLATCIRLDPRNPRLGIRLSHTAIGYYFCGDYDAAALAASQAIRSYPDYPISYHWLTASLGQLGRDEEAKAALKKSTVTGSSALGVWVRQRAPWMQPNDHAHLVEGLRKAGWVD